MNEERKAAVESTVDFVVGRVVEIGDIECLGNKPGLVIETTMEQLRAHGRNLAFCDVEIRLKANARPHAEARSDDSVQADVGTSE